MNKCKVCELKTNELFAPFDQGDKLYCSDCQLEAEVEISEFEADSQHQEDY